MNTSYLMKKKFTFILEGYTKFKDLGQVLISLHRVVFSFKIYFSFSFWSDFNLDSAVVKVDKISGLKQLFSSCFLLIGKKNFFSKIN